MVNKLVATASPENLVQEITDVVVTEWLSFQQLVQVCFHQTLHDVNIFHLVDGRGTDYVPDVDDLIEKGRNW